MTKTRLEAFSDGVIAIIITIMVLELKAPHPHDASDAHAAEPSVLLPMLPEFGAYVLSFVYVGIYWNNHHHLMHAVRRVSGGALWANLHLLFWLSLIPFASNWVGQTRFAPWPVAVYGIVLLLCAVGWEVLRRVLMRVDATGALRIATGRGTKEYASLALYLAGIGAAVFGARSGGEHPSWASWSATATYTIVALVWLVPDRRIERTLYADEHRNAP